MLNIAYYFVCTKSAIKLDSCLNLSNQWDSDRVRTNVLGRTLISQSKQYYPTGRRQNLTSLRSCLCLLPFIEDLIYHVVLVKEVRI